jgi:taurine dioxygenase
MDIRLHENGWTVLVDNIDLNKITQEEVNILAKYVLTNEVLVFKNQNMTPKDQIRVCEMFGTSDDFTNTPVKENFLLKEDPENKIVRVTGELDEHGLPGLFGHVTELEWHCNRVSDPNRKQLVWLYGARGTKGSRTSWLNNILTWQSLSKTQQEELQGIKLDVGQTVQFTHYIWKEGVEPPDISWYKPDLVHTNQLGITGLFFSWNQIHFIEGMEKEAGRKFIDDLRQQVEKEEFIYHHDWDDGDVVISDQYLSIHKRWAFEHIDKRVLHRIAMNMDKTNYPMIK